MSISDTDPHLWLEDVTAEVALDWVRARNAVTQDGAAADADFAPLQAELLGILDTDARIAYPRRRGEHLYNFWRDAEHVRGLWRRTTMDSYRSGEPEWEVLIDLDALAAAEDENWVWAGGAVLREFTDSGPVFPRALVSLSRGGADAVVVREFDMDAKAFITPEDGGFFLPEAKSQIDWIDRDTLYVGTDFGPGSLTDSGYPRLAKRWQRGTALDQAQTVFTGEQEDVAVSAMFDDSPGHPRHLVDRAIDFYTSQRFVLTPDGAGEDQLTELDVPGDSQVSTFRDWLFVLTRSPWTVDGKTYPAGTLLATDLPAYLADEAPALHVVFAPDNHRSLEGFDVTATRLLLTVLADVRTELRVAALPASPAGAPAQAPGGGWATEPLPGVPVDGTVSVIGTDPDVSDEVFLTVSGYLTPPTLLHGTATSGVEVLRTSPAFFDAQGLAVRQFFASSKDGTQVPYFVVGPENPEGPQPTLLYGYGGFENSMTPGYAPLMGAAWLARGGTYVLANIRGGGEYGPEWHTQAVKAGRHRVYEDFAAVARDLVARGVTTPQKLGAQGGSNGGLLMGVMYTAYPELFGALVCQVPLLDMRRYHLLLAGASWMAEYGDPDDPAEWEFISQYSPYQNIRPGTDYPPMLLTTSTRDDRVHPGHARKMMASLEEVGAPVWYFENIEGGHGGAADNAQLAYRSALAYRFLWSRLAGAHS